MLVVLMAMAVVLLLLLTTAAVPRLHRGSFDHPPLGVYPGFDQHGAFDQFDHHQQPHPQQCVVEQGL
jgi:hypothetical protein